MYRYVNKSGTETLHGIAMLLADDFEGLRRYSVLPHVSVMTKQVISTVLTRAYPDKTTVREESRAIYDSILDSVLNKVDSAREQLPTTLGNLSVWRNLLVLELQECESLHEERKEARTRLNEFARHPIPKQPFHISLVMLDEGLSIPREIVEGAGEYLAKYIPDSSLTLGSLSGKIRRPS